MFVFATITITVKVWEKKRLNFPNTASKQEFRRSIYIKLDPTAVVFEFS